MKIGKYVIDTQKILISNIVKGEIKDQQDKIVIRSRKKCTVKKHRRKT